MESSLKLLQVVAALPSMDRFTMIVAAYGAVVATAALAIGVWTALRDRSGIRIDARRSHERWVPCPTRADVVKGRTSMGLRKFVRVSLMNRGRRPVTIDNVVLEGATNGRRQRYHFDDLPQEDGRELGEGRSLVVEATHGSIGMSRVSKVIVQDAVGRTWKKRVKWRDVVRKPDRIDESKPPG